ncbi:hypothetical protein EJ06DRAFT_90211 [Trichodelitschia bisporula]|uniref:Uncharacterized protein n=1 Tax=Trichodelitschia bisporula TaxID=703511 RepID=A0A6G1HSN1_9PEZI|nr:hypothetical protein EJ06DRAFT_90211 [Trichodelitschia bisporula]
MARKVTSAVGIICTGETRSVHGRRGSGPRGNSRETGLCRLIVGREMGNFSSRDSVLGNFVRVCKWGDVVHCQRFTIFNGEAKIWGTDPISRKAGNDIKSSFSRPYLFSMARYHPYRNRHTVVYWPENSPQPFNKHPKPLRRRAYPPLLHIVDSSRNRLDGATASPRFLRAKCVSIHRLRLAKDP